MNKLIPLLAFSILLLVPLGAQNAFATQFQCSADIDGSQEVPPVVEPGTGSATITYDDNTNQLSWNIVFAGLTGVPIAAHFHEAPATMNGGVVIGIIPPAAPVSPLIGNALVPTELNEVQLLLGNWYINIHTQAFPGGEIRGQVSCDPIEVIGGEIIPIESTSLILAGAQSFSWMLPVVLSGIGIGLFVVSRKSE